MRIFSRFSHAAFPRETAVVRAQIHEGLSILYRGEVTCICSDAGLDVEAMLGTEAALLIDDAHASSPRVFHGLVESACFVGRNGDLFAYRLTLRPQVYGLVHRIRSRIFQDETVPEILKKVFSGAGIQEESVNMELGAYPKREYCTQWRESELDFVLRLLEDEGIFFWFEHTEAGHLLKLGDAPGVHQPLEGQAALRFLRAEDDAGDDTDVLRKLTYGARLVPGAVCLRDWTLEKPDVAREGNAQADTWKGLEHYLFPGGFQTNEAGDRQARLRLAALRHRRRVLRGNSPCRRLMPGRTFELTEALPAALCGEYLLLEVTHHFEDSTAGSSSDASGVYRADFTAVPKGVEFRPPRVTPRPRIFGKELANVTCPPGEEIHVDELGRIKVHFYWDREGEMNDTSSCWIRVQQQNTSGSLILPRQGWEVEVGFLYGDPDRPVVLQKLYNEATLPPYGLPDNLHQSSLQSSSTPGGGGTNEIRMSDGAGGMEFFVHAQRDFSLGSGHDLEEKVTANETFQVKTDFTSEVGTTEDAQITGDQSNTVKGACVRTTVADSNVTIGATDQWDVTALLGVMIKGGRTEQVSGLQNVLAQKVAESFKADANRSVGGVMSINALGPINEAVAQNKTEIIAGAKLEVIKGSKAENIGAAKVLNAGAVRIKTGKDVTFAAEGALGITTGGPVAIKCDGDFAIAGKSVTITVGKASMKAGAKIDLTPGSAKLTGSTIGATGGDIRLKGKVKFK